MKNKKLIILIITMLFITTGCGEKKLTCTYSNEMGYKYDSLLIVKYNNNKVSSAKITMTYKDNNVVNSMCDIFKSTNEKDMVIECIDNKITIDNYHLSLKDKANNFNDLKKYLINNGYKCK